MPISWRDDGQKKLLTEIADGTWKHGNVLIEQDRLRPGKVVRARRLHALRGEEERRDLGRHQSRDDMLPRGGHADGRALALRRPRHRGLPRPDQAAPAGYQRDSKASSRWGHGRDPDAPADQGPPGQGQRWRKTKCRVIARRLATWLAERNVARVYVEDFSGIRDGEPERLEGGLHVWTRIQEWPYHELQMRLSACLAELGIETIVVSRTTSPRRAPAAATSPRRTATSAAGSSGA